MDAVKGERRKAGAAADGAQRRPLVPSEKNNAAAAPAGRRREIPSRFKPAEPPAAPPAARRRCASPSPGASSVDGSTATCNRARSADRARPAAPSAAAAPSSRLKPSALAAARSSSPAAARDAAAEAHGSGTPPRARNAKASDGLSASARSSSPLVRPEPVPAATPAKKIDRRVHGLPSELTKLRSGAAVERKRSPLRGRTNNIGDQCENARVSESPASRVIEHHRWPGMMTGRGNSAGLTSTSSASAEKTTSTRTISSQVASAGRSPRRMHPSEGTGKSLKRPSIEAAKIVHRRRKDKADSSSDTSSQKSESSKSNRGLSKAVSSPVTVLHRSSSPRQGLAAAPAASACRSCQSPSRMRPSAPAPCQSKCAPSYAQSGVEQPGFNYFVDARKGKKNAGQIEDIHQLRLLNNRYLQWRLVNAHSEDTLSQKNGAEVTLAI